MKIVLALTALLLPFVVRADALPASLADLGLREFSMPAPFIPSSTRSAA